ncbi:MULTISPECIES: Ig-like domain-containing protein [Pseudoalteromonas]|uniref:Ig-like domain-containing protein n=1 Tax=Pseudoalteromonas TaxID=53246 RepID=UPI00037CE409|nr:MULTISPECIES: Ig-like domain-containing protein [Pseudoalteromonas]
MPLMRWLSVIMLSFLITACGGGGTLEKEGGELGGDTDVATYTLTISAISEVTGEAANNVSANQRLELAAKLLKDGAAVPGSRVTFTTDGDYGVFNPVSGTAETDADGIARVFLSVGSTAGAGTVSASVTLDGTSVASAEPFTFTSTGELDSTSQGDYSITLQGYAQDTGVASNTVTNSAALDLRATLKRNGEIVAGKRITFQLADNIGLLSPSSALTQNDGIATVELSAGSDAGAGQVSAVYTIEGVSYSGTFDFQSTGGQDNVSNEYILILNGVSTNTGAPSNLVTPNDPITLQANLQHNGEPLSGEKVTFTLSDSIGELDPPSGTALTNSQGIASISLLAGDVEGAGEVVFSYTVDDDTYVSAPFTFEAQVQSEVVTEVNVNVLASNDLVTRSIDYLNPARAQATVTVNGQPAAFKFVTFNLTGFGILNPSNGTAMTNEQGIAEIDLLTGTTQGAGSITATYVNDKKISTTSTEFVYETAGDSPAQNGDTDYALSISLISTQTLTETNSVSADNSAQVKALVLDSEGNPVTNQVVNFSTTLGRLLPSLGTALTDTSGIATLNLTAGSIEGAGIVTAQFDNQQATIGFYTRGDVADSTQNTADISFKLLKNCLDGFTNSRDATLCDEVTSFSSEESGVLYVQALKNGSNTPLEQVLVTATTTIGSISPTTGTAITDANGVALLDIIPGRDVGAGEVTVSVLTSSLTKAFQIAAVDVEIEISSNLADSDLLSAGSTALISVEINKEGALFTSPLLVEFSSGCVDAGLAVIDARVTSIGGVAQSTYRATGCVGADQITASVITGGTTVSDNIVVNVSKSNIGSIEFLDSSESVIALKGTGGANRKETSTLRFKLVDNNGNPIPSKTVNFELSTTVGGVKLSQSSGFTNAEGIVQTVVQSGVYPQPVKVIASSEEVFEGQTLKVIKQSDELAISTGVADQNSFSTALSAHNVHALDLDGTQVEVTARLADHFGNPVPDGTVVSFIAEGGMIAPNCQTSNGNCSVTWESSNPRPFTNSYYQNTIMEKCDRGLPCPMGILNDDYSIDLPLGGRATILSYALGEESYNDKNGNGLFDSTDFFAEINDRPEAFIDNNSDNTYGGEDCAIGSGPCSAENSDGDEFEEFIDYNSDGTWTTGNGVYDGLLCTEADDTAGICKRGLIHIFNNSEIVMSNDDAAFRVVTFAPDCSLIPGVNASEVRLNSNSLSPLLRKNQSDATSDLMCQVDSVDFRGGTTEAVDLTVYIADIYNNPMPVGTVVSISTDNGVLSGADEDYIFPNTTSIVPISLSFVILDEQDDSRNDKTQGAITVKVAAPNGLISTTSISVLDDPAP